MLLIIIWLIIGAAVGGGVHWLMESRSQLGKTVGVVIGLLAGVAGGYIFLQFGTVLVNEGPLPIVSFLAAAISAAVVVIIAGLIKR